MKNSEVSRLDIILDEEDYSFLGAETKLEKRMHRLALTSGAIVCMILIYGVVQKVQASIEEKDTGKIESVE